MTNMIFLALSLLHSDKPGKTEDIDSSLFFPADKEGKSDGIIYIGQMEPIVIWKATQYGEDDLVVIALCTEKVMCDEYSKEDPVTSAQFFMQSVCEQTDTDVDLSSYKKEFCRQEYESINGKIRFILIPIDEENTTLGIRQSVDAIREWNGSKQTGKEKFWLDAHGGFRSTMTILSGIISLLKIDNIIPDEIYSPRYDNKAKIMRLPEKNETFEIFDFVSGMNDFINYGNADLLKQYFRKHKASAFETSVLEAIDKIALGTQCCDTISYKAGLKELSRLLQNPNLQGSSMLSIFLDYIRDSYGDLLTNRRTTLLIVERCVEKKLYQQALTFIESSMPDEIVKKGLVTFSIQNYSLPEVNDYASEAGSNYYLFDSYLKMGNMYPVKESVSSTRSKTFLKKSVRYCAQHEQDFRRILNGDKPDRLEMDTFVNTESRNNFLPFDKTCASGLRNLPPRLTGIGSKITENNLDALGIFLRFYQLLKRCRNSFNHGLEDRPALSDLLCLLDLYIQYADFLYRKC